MAAVIFDLEFTAWPGSLSHRWMRPGEYTELVQIGAVRLDAALEEAASFQALVRPRVNAVLSPYLENLTGITNERLSRDGMDFAVAYEAFRTFCAGAPIIAFGRDDLIFEANIRLYGLSGLAPLPPYRNIVPWLIAQGMDVRGMHACDVGPRAGVPFQGRTHDALDDARSVAAGIRALVDRGAPPPLGEGGVS